MIDNTIITGWNTVKCVKQPRVELEDSIVWLLQRQQNHQQWTAEGHYLVTQLQL